MFVLNGSQAFWIFTGIELMFLGAAIAAARLVSPKKPNKIKNTIYECGQDPFGEAKTFRILGIARYFGYAVAFFALDAFAWVVLTAAMSIQVSVSAIASVSLYVFIILIGVGYCLSELNN